MSWFDEEFWSQLTIGLAGALLGFLGTFLVAQWTERRKPKQRLSYDLRTHRTLGEIGEDLAESVQILYRDTPVTGLYISTFTIENTGTTVVRDQQIRFKTPKGARVLETALDPVPESEWGVKLLPETQERPGPIYVFGHLEKGNKATVRLIIASEVFPDVQIVPHNESGDVAVVRRSIAAKVNIENRIKTAIALLLMLAIVPRFFSSLGEFGDLAAGAVTLGLTIAVLPYGLTLLSVIANMLTRTDDERRGVTLHDARIQELHITQWSEGSKKYSHRVTMTDPTFPETDENKGH